MMSKSYSKHLFLLSFLLSASLALWGQGYHPFPAGDAYYSFQQPASSHTWLFATHMDSVRQAGPDILHYLYRIDRPRIDEEIVLCSGDTIPLGAPGVAIAGADHYFGNTMRLEPSGDCIFELRSGLQFLLKTQATSGSSWTWNGAITATVDSTVEQLVLGALDSVKYIGLSNGRTIALSKQHGLVRFINLYPFGAWNDQPVDVDFHIWGIPSLSLGGTLPTYGSIFQFQPGDKFGHHKYIQDPGGYGEGFKCKQVISQTPGIRFEYQDTFESIQFVYPQGFPMDTIYQAPMAITDAMDSLLFPELSLLPYQHNPATETASATIRQAGVRIRAGGSIQRIEALFDDWMGYDSCAHAHYAFETFIHHRFAQGLGRTWYSYFTVGGNESDTMYCYQVDGDSWGNCIDIGAIVAIQPSLMGLVKVYPNPAHDHIRLDWPTEAMAQPRRIEVWSTHGQLLKQDIPTLGTSQTELLLDDLPQGLYLLRAEASGFQPCMLRLLVQ